MARLFGFSMGKVKTVDFSETIAACDLKVGRCRKLIEIMKVQSKDIIIRHFQNGHHFNENMHKV